MVYVVFGLVGLPGFGFLTAALMASPSGPVNISIAPSRQITFQAPPPKGLQVRMSSRFMSSPESLSMKFTGYFQWLRFFLKPAKVCRPEESCVVRLSLTSRLEPSPMTGRDEPPEPAPTGPAER